MFKQLSLIFILCTYSLMTQAAQLHFFSGYSRPEAVTREGETLSLTRKSWKGFVLGGFGVNMQPWRYITLEGSLFFPGCLGWGYKENKIDATKISSVTGIPELTANIILPIFKLPLHMRVYAKTGLWGLHALSKTCHLTDKHVKPAKDCMSGYGWVLGGGFIISTPFWPKLPIDVSAAYYSPFTLPIPIVDRLPHQLQYNCIRQGFWSIKCGFMWPR